MVKFHSQPARLILLSVAASLAVLAPVNADDQDLLERIDSRLDASFEQLVEIRRDLHRHPEVSGEEERTAGIVAARLRELGFEIETGIGGHGVVGILRGARERPLVAFRADMDAVPSDAPDPVEFRSEKPGIRHICGHDIHTTVGLALAEALAEVQDELPGSVLLLFQPAEETASGAKAMLADQVFAETRPDAIYAYHTAPLEVGQVATTSGGMMAGRDRLTVRITGDGDQVEAGKQVREAISAISTLSQAEAVAPVTDREFLFVQVGTAVENETGDGLRLNASITNASSVAREKAQNEIEQALAAIAVDGVALEHDYEAKWIAGVTNDVGLTERAASVARSVLGEDSVLDLTTVVPAFSEDFGSFQDEVPGVMFFLGVSNSEKGLVGMPHSPGYAADEASILVGAKTMAAILLDRLGNR